MRKLNKKQKTLITDNVNINHARDKRAFFIIADTLQNYDAINNINIYENLDTDIERFYNDQMVKAVLNAK
jgi:hypothetical protein